jgi:16S rRNA G966 N2-methylase RsmD
MIRRIFDHLLKPAFVEARRRIIDLLERREGITTQGRFEPEALGFTSEHRTRYQPSNWLVLRRILPPREVGADDVFIDLGSGMGRIVFQAAKAYRFRRVIGVELSKQLHAIAEENVANNKARLRCPDIRLVASDVMEYEMPADVTVVYLANPFTGPIFQDVVDRLVTSVACNPRPLRVIYFNPVEERRLLSAGFECVRTIRGMRPGRAWSLTNTTRMYRLSGTDGTRDD